VASANCGLYCGANIDFVDIDSKTYNMSVDALSDKLTKAEKLGKLPKIVVPVHFAGQPCDMTAIHDLSKQYGFKIIEDASHAIGASYNKIKIGSCTHSDITVFSFHPIKIITTAEGGMALTNNKDVADKIGRLRTHGITSDKTKMKQRSKDEIWNYQQINLGFNYRMTDIQAALGVSQMTRLYEIVEKRHGIAKRYDDALAEFPLQTQWQPPDSYSSYHLYSIRLKLGEDEQSQIQVYDALHTAGILVNLHYIPIYRQPYYEVMGFKEGYCPEAELYHKEALSIPMYPTLTEYDQSKVISSLHDVLG